MNKIVLAVGVLAAAGLVGYLVKKKRKEEKNNFYNVVEIKRGSFDERDEFSI